VVLERTMKGTVAPLPAVWMMKTQVPSDTVKDVNKYLDNLLKEDGRQSQAKTLVGQIKKGEQLVVDFNHENIKELSSVICMCSKQYIEAFFNHHNQKPMGERRLGIYEMWSVHAYEGDYNPLHDHGVPSVMGLSCILYLKVPNQILDTDVTSYLFDSSGIYDGHLVFNYGRDSQENYERLIPPSSTLIKPKVGEMYVFPSWLQHMVYPFSGEGERRSLSANITAWRKEDERT
jgi:hypothetical protein